MNSHPASEYCRVCGLYQGEPIYGPDGHSPTFNICDCCGVEFGYQDGLLLAIYQYREHWIQAGCLWRWPKSQPKEWDVAQQMAQIPPAYR